MNKTCDNLNVLEVNSALDRIQKRIKKLNNIRLRHLIDLENQFSDVKRLLSMINNHVDEVQFILNESNICKMEERP